MPEGRLQRTRAAYALESAQSLADFAMQHLAAGGILDKEYLRDPRRLALLAKKGICLPRVEPSNA